MAGVSTYTEDIAAEICCRIASGESVKKITQDENMPSEKTVYYWLSKEAAFSQQYARAREAQADVYAQEIVTIADDAADLEKDAALARLQMDARKWASSKLAPKKYGDKLDMNLGGQPGNPVVHKIERKIVRPSD